LLKLYYGKGLTQQEIAKQQEMKQYTVSRRLSAARRSLLAALVKWSQETLQIEMTPEKIENVSNVLELWLQDSFGDI
jgi:DNA-binding transcriptional regulator LsrR (DeoR family)